MKKDVRTTDIFLSFLLINTVSLLFFFSSTLCTEHTHRFILEADNLFLVNPDTQQELDLSTKKAIVTACDGALYLNKKRLRLPIVIIKSTRGSLICNDVSLDGAAIISYMRDGACSCVPYTPQEAEQKAVNCVVKVLLEEKELRGRHCWKISSKEKIVVINPEDTEKKKLLKTAEISLECKKGTLYLNGKRYIDDVCMIASSDNHLMLNDTQYHGSLMITKHKERYMIINHVPLEEYLYSVLRSESWPGWPLEVNKAFAITSRSYVIAMIMGSKKNNKPYHVKNSNIHQTYRGVHTHKALKDAVEQTKGVFLAHNDVPITAMFDSCCGGIVPAHIHGPDFAKAPYLARSYPCTYCRECKIFNWQAEYDLHSLALLLESEQNALGMVKGLKISKKDKAGLVQEVHVKGIASQKNLSSKQLYSALKEVKSFCFSAQRKSNKIILKGKGYGHHIGLCQWGAREMVRQGWNYKSILQFYYPGTSFMKLS